LTKAIYFDMDGTIVNLYAVPQWREQLDNCVSTPYAVARPLVDMARLARYIHKVQALGYTVGIITWLSRRGDAAYAAQVAQIKQEWLRKHLPSVRFDEMHIVPYGTPKEQCAMHPRGILFDDNTKVLARWLGDAHMPQRIFDIMRGLR
jgi:hypothetical protein